MKDVKTLFRVLNEYKTSEDRIIRDVRNLFKSGKEGEKN